MAVVTAQVAYDKIVAHIKKEGSAAKNWYAGIASDWLARLKAHGIEIGAGRNWYIREECSTTANARAVEEALIEYGCDGGGGGGSASTVWVYAYRKTASTDP